MMGFWDSSGISWTICKLILKLQFIHSFKGDGSKTAKIIKKVILPTSHCLNVNVMLSNMTFLMIFAVFDPMPLTLWINCSF